MLRKHNTEKLYDLIMIMQNTYKELYTLILIDLKEYYWYMQYYFQILTRQNKCFDLNILNITHIGYSVNKNS